MSRKAYNEAPECLVGVPLNQFKAGQVLCFHVTINPGFHAHMVGKFVKLDRGLVHVMATDILSPEWYDWRYFERKYPDRVARLRPKSCHLWGQGPADTYAFCHWFKDAKTPVV